MGGHFSRWSAKTFYTRVSRIGDSDSASKLRHALARLRCDSELERAIPRNKPALASSPTDLWNPTRLEPQEVSTKTHSEMPHACR